MVKQALGADPHTNAPDALIALARAIDDGNRG